MNVLQVVFPRIPQRIPYPPQRVEFIRGCGEGWNVRWPFIRRGKVKVLKPLPRRIDETVSRLEVIRTRLRSRIRELEARSKQLFDLIVKAQAERENDKAVTYANELAELRRMIRKAVHSELALEGVVHRLQTLRDLDEIGDALAPLREVLIAVGGDVRGVAPRVSESIRSILDSLDEVSAEVGRVPEMGYASPTLSEEARRILAEASEIAARRSGREAELPTP